MFPIRVVVESVQEGECCKCSDAGVVVTDSFAIVPGETQFSQLVETVLSALSMPHLAHNAKGEKFMFVTIHAKQMAFYCLPYVHSCCKKISQLIFQLNFFKPIDEVMSASV